MLMLLPRLIARKWIRPGMDRMIAEGNADAIAAAEAATVAAVTAARNKEWRAWLDRHDAAVAKGEPFTEPAPDEIGQPPATPLAANPAGPAAPAQPPSS